jgi:SAM-dependent methyltransferase
MSPSTLRWGDVQLLRSVRRSIRLFKEFRTQFDDEERFYTLLGDDTVALVKEQTSVVGRRVVDIGGGRGYFAAAFRRAGAASVFVEPLWEAMGGSGRSLGYGLVGDGRALPFVDGAFDISHSSNVLEHVEGPAAFLDEMVRVVRPGGLVFLAFTNWLSPFGGHETAPWHYLGGEMAARRYEWKHGHPPKNRYGEGLFKLHIGDVLALTEMRTDVEVIDAYPRYYPRWARPVLKMPGLREVATWNLVVVMRRRIQSTTPERPVHRAQQAIHRTHQAIPIHSPTSIRS